MVWGTFLLLEPYNPSKSAPECPFECGGGLTAIWAMAKQKQNKKNAHMAYLYKTQSLIWRFIKKKTCFQINRDP